MHTLGAEFYIELHSLSALEEVLGRSITVDLHPIRYRIDLPTSADSFEFDPAPRLFVSESTPPDPRDYDPNVAVLHHNGDLVDVRLIRIVANARSELTVDDFVPSDPVCEREYDRIFNSMRMGALELARHFCMAVSLALDQYWIEPSGEYPKIVNFAGLIDLTRGRSFGRLVGASGFLRIITEDSPLRISALDAIARILRHAPESLQPDEVMLAEARRLVDSLPQPVVAPERSTLLASMALELRIKRVALLFERESTQSATTGRHSTYTHDRFLQLVKRNFRGIELLEGRALASHVQSLFKARDRIVHHGTVLERETASRHVTTARSAFTKLQEIEARRDASLTAVRSALIALRKRGIDVQ